MCEENELYNEYGEGNYDEESFEEVIYDPLNIAKKYNEAFEEEKIKSERDTVLNKEVLNKHLFEDYMLSEDEE